MTTLDDFLTRIKSHAQWSPVEKEDRVRFMALALCGEVGELANLVKKDWRGDSGDRRDQIKEELADAGAYLFLLADVLGVDLFKEMWDKLLEVEQRPEWKAFLARQSQ